MSSGAESSKSDDEELSSGFLLRDIEEISKALYMHKGPLNAFNSTYDHSRHVAAHDGISDFKANVNNRDSSHKDKKSSMWNWKPIKALIHTWNHRFNCCFFLHVHAIEGLPLYFNKLKLCVTWKRKAKMLRTHPAEVHLGMAEFEETLLHQCTINVGRTGPHGSAKYDPKLFLLHASVVGGPTLDIGSRWVDLTRLLPQTLGELLAGDKSSSGKWSTSFKLTGMAKGAVLNVSFGFSIFDGSSVEPGYFAKVPGIAKEGRLNHFADSDTSRTNQLHDLGSVPMSLGGSYQQSQSGNLKSLEEMFLKQGTDISQSVTLLYQKLDERKMGDPVDVDLYRHLESWMPMPDSSPDSEYGGGQTRHEFDDAEFDVIEQGIEVPMKHQIKRENGSSKRFDSSAIETIDVAEFFKGEETDFVEHAEWNSKLDADNVDEYECTIDAPEPAFEEFDPDFFDLSTSKPSDLDSLLDRSAYEEHRMLMRSESSNRAQSFRRSLSLDNFVLAESIEDDFLNMLSIAQDQEDIVSGSGNYTPKDLLGHCEEDPLAWGDVDLKANGESCSLTPSGYSKVASAVDLDFQAVERNHHSIDQSFRDKRNAEMLENLETEALMNQWGLTEKAFQHSPCTASGGFGSPVYIPNEEPLQLPPILEGKGPIVQTKGGGFLRSMNPLLFRNANNGARLIVQVSAPVVLPSAMGSTAVEMLQCWAHVGVKMMCFQAKELMPLQDVTGKTIYQVLAEAELESDASNRSDVQSSAAAHSSSGLEQIDSDYVSIEDLVPMAITNIEGLLVEGLKIQSGMADQEPPSSIRIPLVGNSTLTRKASELSSSFGAERSPGVPFVDAEELIKYSLSLEEWLRLDSGQLSIEEDDHEHVLKLFAAHAKHVELGNKQRNIDDQTIGGFAENFRMGIKVQLRDPLRNFESVGPPMLALVQVNWAYSPPQPEVIKREDDGADNEQNRKSICQPMFKVSEVHLAGFNIVRHGNKPIWGSSREHQSGSRWLHSSGMARSKKNLISNSNIVVRSPSGLVARKAKAEDVLWSISVPVEGEVATWDESIAMNVHVRNSDIIFPIESV